MTKIDAIGFAVITGFIGLVLGVVSMEGNDVQVVPSEVERYYVLCDANGGIKSATFKALSAVGPNHAYSVTTECINGAVFENKIQ